MPYHTGDNIALPYHTGDNTTLRHHTSDNIALPHHMGDNTTLPYHTGDQITHPPRDDFSETSFLQNWDRQTTKTTMALQKVLSRYLRR